jgi:hypothetical protein
MSNERVTKALGEKMVFTIKNTSGAVKVVALLAAFFDTLLVTATANDAATPVVTVVHKYSNPAQIVAAGYACDAVVDDGTFGPGLECITASSKKAYRAFREYIKNQGRLVLDMSIQANNVAAFNGSMEVITCSPLIGDTTQTMYLSEFYSIDQSSTSKINVNAMNLALDYDKLILLPIQNGHEITFTMKF